MIKLSNRIRNKKIIVFNLIVILSLMISFISYKIFAATSDHLVIEAAQFSGNGEVKIQSEFSSDYISNVGEFVDGTPIYANDLLDYKAFLKMNRKEALDENTDMGRVYYNNEETPLDDTSDEFIKIASDTGIDKRIWFEHGVKFQNAATNKDNDLLQTTKGNYNADYAGVAASGRNSTDTDFVAIVPNGAIDDYSELEGKKVTQKLYNSYKKGTGTLDEAEEYIIAYLGDSDMHTENPSKVQKALWYYRAKNGLSRDDDYDETDIDEQTKQLVEEAENYRRTPRNISDDLLLNVKWKKGVEGNINYDDVKVNYDSELEAYIVGPFALVYDGSIASFKDMATLELYTNMEDLQGIDLKDPAQEQFGIVQCDINNGRVIKGYDDLNKEFPGANEPFYIKLNVTDRDELNMDYGEFLAVSRCISNVKVKLRVPEPEVEVEFLEGYVHEQEFTVKSIVDGDDKIYYLEPGEKPNKTLAKICHVKKAQIKTTEKEVNKYLDIKFGKLYFNSSLYDSDVLDDGNLLKSDRELAYKVRVTGNILKENGTAEDYDEEIVKVPLTGQVVSRDYAWVGNVKPKFEITIDGFNEEVLELIDNEVEFIDTKKGVDVDGDHLGTQILNADPSDNYKISGELINGIITLNYNYYAKYDSGTLRREDCLLAHGKIAIDNIARHDESLSSETYNIASAKQAYMLTIYPGENSLFRYGDESDAFSYGQEGHDKYQKIVILEGREENEDVEEQNHGQPIDWDVNKFGNRFISKDIVWPKGDKPPTYTVDRIDDIPLFENENQFVDEYKRVYIEKITDDESNNGTDKKSYFIDGLNAGKYDFEEYAIDDQDPTSSNDGSNWDGILNELGISTYRAIINDKETSNTSGTVVQIDDGLTSQLGNSNRNGFLDLGTNCVRFVTDHRKKTGEIVFEKVIDLEDDEFFENIVKSNPDRVTELFEQLKDDLKFEFEIGIGTDVQTITLDKNYREPNYQSDGKVCGYKWVWRSGEKEWLCGNDLYYTVRENLNTESVLFSRIDDSQNQSYDIHGNIATGSFRDFIDEHGQNKNPITFHGTFNYEECSIDINENLVLAGSSSDDASPIKNYADDDDCNVRKMLFGSDLFFNLEVNGIYVYKTPDNTVDDNSMGHKNYRILNGKKEIRDSSGNLRSKGYIDLDSGNVTDEEVNEEFVLDLNEMRSTVENLEQSVVSSSELNDGRANGIGKFIWIKGIPPKYVVEQDTKKIIEKEVQKLADGVTQNKEINILKDLVSWQTHGTKEGVLESKWTEKDISDTHHMKFEFTNDIPSIEREMKTGRIFIKQYVYGSDDYLKEVQKDFEFVFKVDVTANKWNDSGKTSTSNDGIHLLTIDELRIKAEVSDDGNYVWEWTSPDITWDDEYLNTPIYTITLDESKLPPGMTFDFAEKVNRDISIRLGHESGLPNDSIKAHDPDKIPEITGKLSEIGKNENEDRYDSPTNNLHKNLDVDERPETTDVFFYASKGVANRGKIKLVQSFESKKLLREKEEPEPITICVSSDCNFEYNNESFDANETYYLTKDKRLVKNKSADTELQLDIDENRLVNTYESNYLIWADAETSDGPVFWVDDDNNDAYRNIFPCPKKNNPYSIATPIGVNTITDSYFEKSQNNKGTLVINVKDAIVYNKRNPYDPVLPTEYKKSLDVFFKVHVNGRGDTYLKAKYDEANDEWKYEDNNNSINIGTDSVDYSIVAVYTNPKLEIKFSGTGNTYENNNITIARQLQPNSNENEFYYDEEGSVTRGKGRIHIVALRSDASNREEFKTTIYRKNLKIKQVNQNDSTPIEQTLAFDKGKYSTELYTDSFIINNKMAPYEVIAEGEVNGRKCPNYWNTNSGQGVDCNEQELINVVIDYTANNDMDNDNTFVDDAQIGKISINRELDGQGIENVLAGFTNSGNTNIQKRPCMIADMYVQGYGTKKYVLYGNVLKNAIGSLKDDITNLKKNDTIDEVTPWVQSQSSWVWKNRMVKHDNSWKFDESGADDTYPYLLDSAETLDYRIIDYELPNGYSYKMGGYEDTFQSTGILSNGNLNTESKRNEIKYDVNTFPISRVLAIENRFNEKNIKVDVTYKAEVSGTYQYIIGGEIHRVVNGTRDFEVQTNGDGIFAFTDSTGTTAKFVWDYDSKPPRYNISMNETNGVDNKSFENAAGYMNESAITYATAKNNCEKIGGYICIEDVFFDKDKPGEVEHKIRPQNNIDMVVSVFRKKEGDEFELINIYSGKVEEKKSIDGNIWLSPRVSWYKNDEIYYKVMPINCKEFRDDSGTVESPQMELRIGDSANLDVIEQGALDQYGELGKKYFRIKEHTYDDIYRAADDPDVIEHTYIKYWVKLKESTVTFKNARVWIQNPDDKSVLNQNFTVKMKLDGFYKYDESNKGSSETTLKTNLKSQSSDSKENVNEADSVKQRKIQYFPNDRLKLSVEETIDEGDGNHPDKWKNINISNTNNYLDGDMTIYLTNQYNEFKDIDLTTSLGGKVSFTDTVLDENNKIIEVYARKVSTNDLDPEEDEEGDPDDENIGGPSGSGDELVMVNKFGTIQKQPAYTDKTSGRWEMPGVFLPQLYSSIYEIYYKYDGQMFKATDAMSWNECQEYMSNPDVREAKKDACKVAESAYEREKFDKKFGSIRGEQPEDISGKSTSVISYEDSVDGKSDREIGYVSKREDEYDAASELDTKNDNYVRDRFAMIASTTVIKDEYLEKIDNQEIEDDDIDYNDEAYYEHYLKYPADDLYSAGSDTVLNIGENIKFISGSYLKDINLTLEPREDVNVILNSDLVNVRYAVNGKKDDLYNLNPADNSNSDVTISVSSTDYYYREDIYRQNENYGYLKNLYKNKDYNFSDSEMDIYLTYKYTIENNNNEYVIRVDKLNNYVSDSVELLGVNANVFPSNYDIKTGNMESIAGTDYLKNKYGEDGKTHYDDFTCSIIPDQKASDGQVFDKLSLNFRNKNENKGGIFVEANDTHTIYVDFKVKKKAIEGVSRTLDIGEPITNIIEIGEYATLYDATFAIDDPESAVNAGKVSNSFAPDNLNLGQAFSCRRYEEDTEECNTKLTIKLDYEGKTKKGVVYEKPKDNEKKRDGQEAKIGGMTVQMLERMYVSKDTKDDFSEPKEGYDFLWSTDRPLNVYGGKSMYEVQSNGIRHSVFAMDPERFRSTVETGLSDSDAGKFRFINIPNGKFVVRVLYGYDKGLLDNTCESTGDPIAIKDDGTYYAKDINGGEVLTANYDGNKSGTTAAVYNGQDYKSYSVGKNDNGIIAYGDDEARRIETISQDMTFNNDNTRDFIKLNDKAGVHQKVYDNYYMFLVSNNIFSRDVVTNEEEVLALMERPKTEIYTDEQIESIKIITNDNKVIFDAEYDISYEEKPYEHEYVEGSQTNYKYNNPNGNAYAIKDIDGKKGIFAIVNLNKDRSTGFEQLQQLYKDENKLAKDREKYATGVQNFKYVNIDHTILQGTTIEINYRISSINVGEEDYIGNRIGDLNTHTNNDGIVIAKNTRDFGNYNNQMKLLDMAKERRIEIAKSLGSDLGNTIDFGKILGDYYYSGIASNGEKQVRTRVRQVLNYVDNDAVFMTEKNNTDNMYWRASSAAELNGNGLDRNRLVETGLIDIYKVLDKNDMAYMTRSRNNIALSVDEIDGTDGVKNDDFESVTVPYSYYDAHEDERDKLKWQTHINILSTKTVSTASDADNMSFETLSEITKYENTAGRRDEVIHIGNADPKRGEYDISLKERDSSSTEIVTFMPPTGISRIGRGRVYVMIALVMMMALSGGTIITLKVRQRRQDDSSLESKEQ